jgi:hypothetical protein
VNDDDANVEPVELTELSPTRAELIARVRARGRQIRTRRRLAVTALTAVVVLAIAAPAIVIGRSSHGVAPANVVHGKGDLRIAPIREFPVASSPTPVLPPCPSGMVLIPGPGNCVSLGPAVVTASDVRSASVVYDDTQGWIVNVEMSRAAAGRLAAEANEQVAIIVDERVVSAPVIQQGITGTIVSISGVTTTREQAIALATKIGGGPPAHVATGPDLTATIEVPVPTIVSGATAQETIVIVNDTDHAITLMAADGCPAVWKAEINAVGGAGVSIGSLRLGRPACPKGTALEPGTNRVPLTVTARALCFANADPNLGIPACLADGQGPPLAPGVYDLKATADSEATPLPDPVLLRVVGR